jgi:phosphoribosylglycinamide formyltransferase
MSCTSAARAWSRPRLASKRAGTGAKHRRAPAPRAAATRDAGPARVAVFVSGGGSNMRALHAAMLDGRVDASVAVVVSNSIDCGGIQWANDNGLPTLRYPPSKQQREANEGLSPDALVEKLESLGVTHVCLAGYLRLIPPELCRRYENKMLNVHPALLPAFGGKGMHGLAVHEAVVASGARFTGPTIHFVNEKFDDGKILAQRVVPVFPTDTPQDVAKRVLEKEHEVFPHALAALVEGRVEFREDGVPRIVARGTEETYE